MPGPPADELRWVFEARALDLVGVSRSTHQSWVREKVVEVPPSGVYSEGDLLELVLVDSLRDCFSLVETRSLWRKLRRTGAVADFVARAHAVTRPSSQFDLVVDAKTAGVAVCADNKTLAAAVRGSGGKRTLHLIPLAARIHDVRSGFDGLASAEPVPSVRRGRPPASVRQLKREWE